MFLELLLRYNIVRVARYLKCLLNEVSKVVVVHGDILKVLPCRCWNAKVVDVRQEKVQVRVSIFGLFKSVLEATHQRVHVCVCGSAPARVLVALINLIEHGNEFTGVVLAQ